MRSDYVKSSALRILINSMRLENGIAMRVALETGLRIGDILKLRPCDLNGCKLAYVAAKTGKKGVKTISKSLAGDLRRIQGREWIFEGRTGSKTGHRTRQSVYTDLKKCCKLLGVSGQISPHSARKSYAVDDFQKHGLSHVKKELQHNNEGVTLMYALSDKLNGAQYDEESRQILYQILEIVTDVQQIVNTLAKSIE